MLVLFCYSIGCRQATSWSVPTLTSGMSALRHSSVAYRPGFPDWMHAKARLCAEVNKKTIAMARKAGVKMALGTDFSNSRNTPYLKNGMEFEAMVQAGMTELEALQAGTINAAEIMRTPNLGLLKEGWIADIAVTDGNPLENISCLANAEHIPFVMANGKIVKNEL